MAAQYQQMPPKTKHCLISTPAPGVLLVLINRERTLNSLNVEANFELDAVFRWFDKEPSCRVAIVSGVGRAFCVGADLKEWMENNKRGIRFKVPEGGFGGISFRSGKKPIIAAVNGPAYGGGCEIVVNCDMVIASAGASFSLPEVKRGVTALAGSLPRLMRSIGLQRTMDMVLTGRVISPQEFKDWGVCNQIVPLGGNVVDEAVRWATMIADNSPDSVIVSREGVRMGWDALGIADASSQFMEGWGSRIYEGRNLQEGLNAFAEKRKPVWADSKL